MTAVEQILLRTASRRLPLGPHDERMKFDNDMIFLRHFEQRCPHVLGNGCNDGLSCTLIKSLHGWNCSSVDIDFAREKLFWIRKACPFRNRLDFHISKLGVRKLCAQLDLVTQRENVLKG